MSKNSKLFRCHGGKNFKTTLKVCLFSVVSAILVACGNTGNITVKEQPYLSSLSLHEKASNFQLITESEFVSPEGLLCYKKPSGHKGYFYDNYDKQTSLTSMQILAEIHRYKSTLNMDAIYNLNKYIGGLERLFDVTNVSGYPARSMAPSDKVDINWKWHGADPSRNFSHPLTKYHWNGNASKDEMAHLVLTLSEACMCLDNFPRLQNRSRKLLLDLAEYFFDNYQNVIDINGQVAKEGDLTGEIVVIPMLFEISIGYNHFISMAIYTAAYDYCEDKKLKDKFKKGIENIVNNGALNNLKPATNQHVQNRDYTKDNMAFLTARVLLNSPSFEYKDKVLISIQDLWINVRDENNVFWYLLIKDQLNEGHEYSKRLIKNLELFPDTKREVSVDFSSRHKTRFFNNSNNEAVAVKAPLLNDRPINAFIWSADPYTVQKTVNTSYDYAPVDFLVAYWMGRSTGLIVQ